MFICLQRRQNKGANIAVAMCVLFSVTSKYGQNSLPGSSTPFLHLGETVFGVRTLFRQYIVHKRVSEDISYSLLN